MVGSCVAKESKINVCALQNVTTVMSILQITAKFVNTPNQP